MCGATIWGMHIRKTVRVSRVKGQQLQGRKIRVANGGDCCWPKGWRGGRGGVIFSACNRRKVKSCSENAMHTLNAYGSWWSFCFFPPRHRSKVKNCIYNYPQSQLFHLNFNYESDSRAVPHAIRFGKFQLYIKYLPLSFKQILITMPRRFRHLTQKQFPPEHTYFRSNIATAARSPAGMGRPFGYEHRKVELVCGCGWLPKWSLFFFPLGWAAGLPHEIWNSVRGYVTWQCLFFSRTCAAQTHPLFTYLTQFSHFIIQCWSWSWSVSATKCWAVGVAVVIRMRNPASVHWGPITTYFPFNVSHLATGDCMQLFSTFFFAFFFLGRGEVPL